MTRRAWLGLALVLMLGACRKTSEEDRVRAMLAGAVEALEAGNVGDGMDHVADDYSDEGGHDKAAVKGMLAAQVFRGTRVTIVRRDEKVKVDEGAQTGSLVFDAALFRGDRAQLGGLVPERMGTYRFTLSVRKVDGDWRVAKASWEPIAATSFIVNRIGN